SAQALAEIEALGALDREIMELPEKQRQLVVLCDLQGRTHEEAARAVGCPAGTVSYRLARARELLRNRLTAKGLASVGAALMTAATANADTAVPIALAETTVKAALELTRISAGAVPATPAILLAKGALRSMFISKMKYALAYCVAAVVVGASASMV